MLYSITLKSRIFKIWHIIINYYIIHILYYKYIFYICTHIINKKNIIRSTRGLGMHLLFRLTYFTFLRNAIKKTLWKLVFEKLSLWRFAIAWKILHLDNKSFEKFIYHKRFVYKLIFIKFLFFPKMCLFSARRFTVMLFWQVLAMRSRQMCQAVEL